MNNARLLAGLAEKSRTAVRELEACERSRLAALALEVEKVPGALAEVARVAIPDLATWQVWDELPPALVERFGVDRALLHALGSSDSDVRDTADARLSRGMDVDKAKRLLGMLARGELAVARSRGVGLAFLAVLAKSRVAIAPKYDKLITFHETPLPRERSRGRLVIAALPMGRRLEVLARAGAKQPSIRQRMFTSFLDLAPKLAGVVLAAAPDEAHARRIVEELRRNKLPEVVAAVKRHRRAS